MELGNLALYDKSKVSSDWLIMNQSAGGQMSYASSIDLYLCRFVTGCYLKPPLTDQIGSTTDVLSPILVLFSN